MSRYTIDYTISIHGHIYSRRDLEIDLVNGLIREYACIIDLTAAINKSRCDIQRALELKRAELGWGNEIELTIKTMLIGKGVPVQIDPHFTFRAHGADLEGLRY